MSDARDKKAKERALAAAAAKAEARAAARAQAQAKATGQPVSPQVAAKAQAAQAAGSAPKAPRAKGEGPDWGIIGAVSGLAVVVFAIIGVLVWVTWDEWTFGDDVEVAFNDDDDDDDDDDNDFGDGGDVVLVEGEEVMTRSSDEDVAAVSSSFTAAFADLAGDPMVIIFDEGDTGATKLDFTPSLTMDRRRVPTGIRLVSDVMVSAESRFVTTLPSSPDDFAFFQAQRVAPRDTDEAVNPNVAAVEEVAIEGEVAEELAEIDDASGGWGETLDDSDQALEYAETKIENTTSTAFVRPQDIRQKAVRDIFVKVKVDRDLAGLLADNGFFDVDAKAAAEVIKGQLGLEKFEQGQVIAMRGRPGLGGKLSLLQMSIYTVDDYLGTIAIDPNDQLTVADADPWWEQELFDFAEGQGDEVTQEQRYRMLDAFYSAAIRNQIPSVVVGEAIALLSKSHDLDSFANPGDRMTLIFAEDRAEQDTGTGQILYIGIKGKSVELECFVFRKEPGGEYTCYEAKPKAGAGGGAGGLRNGMVTPVKGVLTSRFGPRKHPILKTVRLHKGVDWAAPTGTPIYAAFDGKVAYAGDGRGYGNLLRLTHKGGVETRYAHLNKFNVKSGQEVRAGEVIGFVGTTGRSTGPHLHFELYVGGTAVDPFAAAGAAATTTSSSTSGSNAAAVNQLVNQIIKVESAGNARAKNPLSTATGLGQFIESTWIRMMRDYRPDLARSMTRAQLLELRFDPTISREMVANLAREGESYLRARGHAINAGRLYLCHFLGAAGAHKVLSSPDSASLLDVLGAGVINANPFLRGKNVAYIKAWADRKMSGKRGAVVVTNAPVVIQEPKGLPEFRKDVQAILRQL